MTRQAGLPGFQANLAALRMQASLIKLIAKHNFNPDEPRIPAGQPGGGRWTGAGVESARRAIAAAEPSSNGGEDIPPKHPNNVSVDDNIAVAESMRTVLPAPLNLLWFYDQVRSKGPWDYKKINRSYADFGNFNYGATGTALGLSQDTLLRMAGWAQRRSGNDGEGVSTSLLGSIIGTGGKPPYGDDQKDQDWIVRGIQYYRAHHNGRSSR